MKKLLVVLLALILSVPFVFLGNATLGDNIPLPPPQKTTMNLEESIWRRSSVRNFTDEPVTDQDLSTLLWAAYGVRGDGSRTIPMMNGTYAAQIYVVRSDAVYTYDPESNTLIFYKAGDFRFISQYPAPVLFGLVWNTTTSADEAGALMQIGMIGQNIGFMADAINLGTVVNGDFPPTNTLARIGLPEHEIPRIIMPVGHLLHPYSFVYLPVWISLLPRIQHSTLSLSTALEQRNESSSWSGDLTRKDLSQIIWSTYGYSPLIDNADYSFSYHISRHRTVPSAHGYYPLQIYAVTKTGVFRYIPNIYDVLKLIYVLPKFPFPVFTFLWKQSSGDHRAEVAAASSNPSIASAPLQIIIAFDRERAKGRDDFSGQEWWWLWYYETGAAAQNVFLESAAWDLTSSMTLPTDASSLRTLLKGNESIVPFLIVPVGAET